MGLSLVAGFAFTLPALADTTSLAPTAHTGWQGKGKGMGMHGMMGKPAVVGTVSAVSGTTITVSGRQGFSTSTPVTTFTVDATNAKVVKANATSSVSSIAVGDTVLVQGTVSGSNITATMIRDGMIMMRGQGNKPENGTAQNPALQGNGEPIIAGTISAVSGASLTVTNKSNVTYTVDTTNAKILAGKTASSLSDLKVGDAVVVQGTVNGNSIAASSVIDQAAPVGQPAHKNIFAGIGQFFSHLFGF